MASNLIMAMLLAKMMTKPPTPSNSTKAASPSPGIGLADMMMMMNGDTSGMVQSLLAKQAASSSPSYSSALTNTPVYTGASASTPFATTRAATIPGAFYPPAPSTSSSSSNMMALVQAMMSAQNNNNNNGGGRGRNGGRGGGGGGGGRRRRNAPGALSMPMPQYLQSAPRSASFGPASSFPSSTFPSSTFPSSSSSFPSSFGSPAPMGATIPSAATQITNSDLDSAKSAIGGDAGIDAIYAQLGGRDHVMEMIKNGQGLPPGFVMPSVIRDLSKKLAAGGSGALSAFQQGGGGGGGGNSYDYEYYDPDSGAILPPLPAPVAARSATAQLPSPISQFPSSLSPQLSSANSFGSTLNNAYQPRPQTTPSSPFNPSPFSSSFPSSQQQSSSFPSSQQQSSFPSSFPSQTSQSSQFNPQFNQPAIYNPPTSPFNSPTPYSPFNSPTQFHSQFPSPTPFSWTSPTPAQFPSFSSSFPSSTSPLSAPSQYSQFPSQQFPSSFASSSQFGQPASSPFGPSSTPRSSFIPSTPVASAPKPAGPATQQQASQLINAVGGNAAFDSVFNSLGGQAGIDAIYAQLGGKDNVMKMLQSGQGLPKGFKMPQQIVDLGSKLNTASRTGGGAAGNPNSDYDYEEYYVDDSGKEIPGSARELNPGGSSAPVGSFGPASSPFIPSVPTFSTPSASFSTPASSPLFAPPDASLVSGGSSLFDFLSNDSPPLPAAPAAAPASATSAPKTGTLAERLAAAQKSSIG